MNKLPQYWFVKRDEDHLLWGKFHTWFNKYRATKARWKYYGHLVDNSLMFSMTDGEFGQLEGSTEITLDDWNKFYIDYSIEDSIDQTDDLFIKLL